MTDDKKNIPEAASPAEAHVPTVENAAVPEQPAPEPALTDAEAVMLEHEGQAALFEMGEAVPDPADAVTHTEVEEPAAPEVPKAGKEQAQPPAPGKDDPAPAHSGKVVDFAAARDEAAKEEKKAVKQKPPTEKDKTAKPGRGRPPKDGKVVPDKAKPPKPRDKKSQSKPVPEKPAVDKGGAPAGAEITPEPSAPRDATRAEKEEIVYLNLSDLHPFKNHPFGVRDDAAISDDVRNGVSVENVYAGNKQWFVLRVSYGRIIKAKAFVETKGFECYVPMRYKEVRKQGKKRIITEPLLPSFLFVHATAEQVETLLYEIKVSTNESRNLLSYYFDHTSQRQDNPDRNPPLTICDEAMNNFIRLTSIKNPHIIPVTTEIIQYKLGDIVIVTEGDFKDIHGRVARIAGQQRVIVELFDGCLVATAYVPKEAMRKEKSITLLD